jgi:hypothetical protein
MIKKKIPDNVVFNEDTQKYDAFLKPYPTNLTAPVITTNDTIAWKNRSIQKVNQKLKATFLELKNDYEKMVKEYEYNNLLFNAKFNFEPIVGEIYHLYKRDNDVAFLSIIAPEQCRFNWQGSFYLNADQIWSKVLIKNAKDKRV